MRQLMKKIGIALLLVLMLLTGCNQFQSSVPQTKEPETTPIESIKQEELPQFRKESLLEEHYQKHVIEQKEFGDITIQEYLKRAQELVTSVDSSVLTKIEEDGDVLFYREKTNEFGVLSKDGYIRTYFKPSKGIEYFNRQ